MECGATRNQSRDVLLQSSRYGVGQLREQAEAALSGFDALVLQLPVQSFDDPRNLQANATSEADQKLLQDLNPEPAPVFSAW